MKQSHGNQASIDATKATRRTWYEAEDSGRNQEDLLHHRGLSLDGFPFTFSYAMEFYHEFPYKINENTKKIYPNKVCLRMG